jgi:hypothetical protein
MRAIHMAENTLYFGDNLSDETIDLIYLDPPLGLARP